MNEIEVILLWLFVATAFFSGIGSVLVAAKLFLHKLVKMFEDGIITESEIKEFFEEGIGLLEVIKRFILSLFNVNKSD